MSDVSLVNAVLPSEVKVPPQGSLYLCAALEAAGFDVDLRDYQHCPFEAPSNPATLARFVDNSAEVVGFSCMSYALPLIVEAAREIKRQDPGKFVVLGGIGPSGVALPLMEYCSAIDAIVIGEGERTAVELMQTLAAGGDLAAVAGLAFRDPEGRPRLAAPRPRIPSLTELPAPAYHRVNLDDYLLVDSQFARGCPYPCSFCDIAPYWDRLTTKRPIEHYLDELEVLVKEHGATEVFIIDDTFVLSRRTILRFCAGIHERAMDFQWGCYARVDLMDDELMAKMAEAGCRKVFYGLESGSDRVLQEIDKNITAERIRTMVQRSLGFFDHVTASFIWGAPTETLEDLEETVFLLVYLATMGASPQLNLVLPYSYSKLYQEYRDRILFEPAYSSQLQFYDPEDREWASAMIAERPDLFSAFYYLPSPDLEQKWQLLKAAGLDPHELQRAYDHPIPVNLDTSRHREMAV